MRFIILFSNCTVYHLTILFFRFDPKSPVDKHVASPTKVKASQSVILPGGRGTSKTQDTVTSPTAATALSLTAKSSTSVLNASDSKVCLQFYHLLLEKCSQSFCIEFMEMCLCNSA